MKRQILGLIAVGSLCVPLALGGPVKTREAPKQDEECCVKAKRLERELRAYRTRLHIGMTLTQAERATGHEAELVEIRRDAGVTKYRIQNNEIWGEDLIYTIHLSGGKIFSISSLD